MTGRRDPDGSPQGERGRQEGHPGSERRDRPGRDTGRSATMQDSTERKGGRGRLRMAAVLPVAVVGWLTLGAGTAMAAPGGHAAATATTATTAAAAMPADAGQANGKANSKANGKGQANGQATGKANGKSGATTSS